MTFTKEHLKQLRQSLEKAKEETPEEAIAFLVRAGILTKKGNPKEYFKSLLHKQKTNS